MKKLLIFVPLIILSLAGCGKDDGGNPAAPAEKQKTIISGKVQSFTPDIGKTIFLGTTNYKIAYTPIKSDGSFSFELVDPPPALALVALYKSFPDVVCFSDPSVNFGSFSFYLFDGSQDKGRIYEGSRQLDYINRLDEPGDCVIEYWYLSADVEIGGTYEHIGPMDGININYDVRGVKGWNKVVHRYIHEMGTVSYYEYTTKLPEESAFYYSHY